MAEIRRGEFGMNFQLYTLFIKLYGFVWICRQPTQATAPRQQELNRADLQPRSNFFFGSNQV